MITGHGGNIYDIAKRIGCAPEAIVDFSSNVNPLGPLPELLDTLCDRIDRIAVLPDAAAQPAVVAFGKRYHLDDDRILAGNGTTQFIYSIPAALNTTRAVIVGPTYADYEDACRLQGASFEYLLTDETRGFQPDLQSIHRAAAAADTVFICNPNNPTGTLLPGADLIELCRKNAQTRFVIDESYLPFVADAEHQSLLQAPLDNCLVLHSMSKIFRIPGLRLGYLVASKGIIDACRRHMQPWSLNGLAQTAAVFLAANRQIVDAFVDRSRKFVDAERNAFLQRLQSSPHIQVYPSTTVFVLARLHGTLDARQVQEKLLAANMLIRDCSNFNGLTPRHIRISLKTTENNQQLAVRLQNSLKSGQH